MFKLFRKLIKFFILIIVAIVAFFYLQSREDAGNILSNNGGEITVVTRVVDGDTFVISSGEKVRLLGIDTPEKYDSQKLERDALSSQRDKETIKKLGELSSVYAENLVLNKKVKLVKEPNHEDKDRYGRLLRYIYLEDGTSVNAKLIRDGYANVYDRFPLSVLDEYRKYEREARENKRGLWGRVDGLKEFE
jgi:micrococcal nuclease